MKEGIKSGPASVSSQPPRDSDHLVANHVENGHESGTAAFSDVGSPEDAHGHSEVVSDAMHDLAANEEVHPDPEVHPEQHASEHPVEDEAHGHEHVDHTSPEEVAGEHEQIHLEVHKNAVPEPADSHADEVTSNGDDVKLEPRAPGTDLEDIVNLLEGATVSKTRPQSIATIPDEIPDEY